MKHRCPGSIRPGLIHSNSRMDAIVVQGQGPLEGGGLSGGVTASFLFELGGPSFDGQPVGGGFTACVPLDGGGVTASPSFRSLLSSTLLFINFLPNLLEGLVETCIPATALAAMGEKGLHSLIIVFCILSCRSHSSAHRQFGGPFRASSSVLPNEIFAFIRSKLGQRVCDPLSSARSSDPAAGVVVRRPRGGSWSGGGGVVGRIRAAAAVQEHHSEYSARKCGVFSLPHCPHSNRTGGFFFCIFRSSRSPSIAMAATAQKITKMLESKDYRHRHKSNTRRIITCKICCEPVTGLAYIRVGRWPAMHAQSAVTGKICGEPVAGEFTCNICCEPVAGLAYIRIGRWPAMHTKSALSR